jgi:thioredoxin-related protein
MNIREVTMVIRIAALLFTGWLAVVPAHAQAQDDMLPVPENLQREAAQAHADRKPFLLMFSLPGCGYCKVVRRNYLVPLLRDASPADRPVIREVQITSRDSLQGFDGKATTQSALATRYGVQVAPTVIVVNAEGELLADPIVGGDNNGFYSAYLDRALEAAEKQFTSQRVKVR